MDFLLKIIIALSIISFPFPAYSRDITTIKSYGVGTVISGGESRARDIAIEDALRRAVEQAVGTFISSESLVRNAVLVNDSIYSHSRGYVKGYTILQEFVDGDLYRVTLETRVSVSGIQNDLEAVGLLMTRKHKPRIMVVIPEHHGNRTISEPAGETEMIREFPKFTNNSGTCYGDGILRNQRDGWSSTTGRLPERTCLLYLPKPQKPERNFIRFCESG